MMSGPSSQAATGTQGMSSLLQAYVSASIITSNVLSSNAKRCSSWSFFLFVLFILPKISNRSCQYIRPYLYMVKIEERAVFAQER